MQKKVTAIAFEKNSDLESALKCYQSIINDYPEADNFLMMFYGGNIKENSSMVNTFKFKNEAYDKLFDKAQREIDEEKRTALLVKCDQMVIDEAPVIPVLTDDHIVMINARIKNFDASPLETINLTSVFIKEPKEKAATEE